jgi:hypothetical protein
MELVKRNHRESTTRDYYIHIWISLIRAFCLKTISHSNPLTGKRLTNSIFSRVHSSQQWNYFYLWFHNIIHRVPTLFTPKFQDIFKSVLLGVWSQSMWLDKTAMPSKNRLYTWHFVCSRIMPMQTFIASRHFQNTEIQYFFHVLKNKFGFQDWVGTLHALLY